MKTMLFLTAMLLSATIPGVFAGDSTARLAYGLYEVEMAACRNNLMALNGFLRAYAQANNGRLPEGNNFDGLRKLGPFGANFNHFVCRANKFKKARDNSALSEDNCPFLYFGGLNLEAALKTSPNIPLMADKPGGRHVNVLFVDGRVEALPPPTTKRKISNCRDLIDALHNKYQYSPEVLEMLRLKAGAIDNAK